MTNIFIHCLQKTSQPLRLKKKKKKYRGSTFKCHPNIHLMEVLTANAKVRDLYNTYTFLKS